MTMRVFDGQVSMEKGRGDWWKIVLEGREGRREKLVGKRVERFFDEPDSVEEMLGEEVTARE